MARWLEGLVAKPGDLSSIPMTHQKVLIPTRLLVDLITSETSRVDKRILKLSQPQRPTWILPLIK